MRQFRLSFFPAAVCGLFMASCQCASGNASEVQDARGDTRLLRQPTVSEAHVAFRYAGDLWVVDHGGGRARRLTTHEGTESHPHFSPDGKEIAFTAQYAGKHDVYVVSTEGGEPRRLTWHPGTDAVEGWTPDGNSVLFSSSRRSPVSGHRRFYTVSRNGGLPVPLAVPRAQQGELSPDGSRLAYQPTSVGDRQWRKYRGGKAGPIWIVDLRDHSLEKLPRADGARQIEPVWLGEKVYFVSDRTGVFNVWAYDTANGTVQQVTDHERFGVMNLDAGGGAVVYQQGGWIHMYDPASNRSRRLRIQANGDFPRARLRWQEVGDAIVRAAVAPNGTAALMEARGEIFRIDAETGQWQNLTGTSGAAERTPAWSPDGEKAAWFSDRSGEYALMIAGAKEQHPPRRIALEEPTFFYNLEWSPDSRHLLFTDADRQLWYLDTESGDRVFVDQDPVTQPLRRMDPTWSPDGRWIAYAKHLDNLHKAIMVYSLDKKRVFPVTHGRGDAVSPAWDPGGKFLYFAVSTNFAMHSGWLDMSTFHRPLTRGIHAAVLSSDGVSPKRLTREDATAGGDGADNTGIRIDPEGLSRRIVPLDLPKARNDRLETGNEPGVLFFLERDTSYVPQPGPGSLHRYEIAQQDETTLMDQVSEYDVAGDGQRLVYQSGDTWGIVSVKGRSETGQGALKTGLLRMHLNPREEWRQIFDEAWRIYRDYFYVDNMHGADWQSVRKKYASWLDHVRSRGDLAALVDLMSGELSVSHAFEYGGDQPEISGMEVGLLGVDLESANGHYRIRRILPGAPWTPDARSPLAEPGMEVAEDDYILAIDGTPVAPPDNPYRALVGTAGREITLRVNDRPARQGSRRITVIPVDSEGDLRLWSWIEDNRRRVEELSDGRIGYVYVPDTGLKGYRFFNRQYFSQQDKEGVVIDGRFNNGGFSPDYMIGVMTRRLNGFNSNPTSPDKPRTEPGSGIWGPKVMVTNEEAGSGGDFLPYFFKEQAVGPIVGRRTAGMEVGAYDYPSLIDGGTASVPRSGFYDANGDWAIENEGVAPDIRVEQTPRAVINGGDPQLERAVDEALRLVTDRDWPQIRPQPPDPETAAEVPRAASGYGREEP